MDLLEIEDRLCEVCELIRDGMQSHAVAKKLHEDVAAFRLGRERAAREAIANASHLKDMLGCLIGDLSAGLDRVATAKATRDRQRESRKPVETPAPQAKLKPFELNPFAAEPESPCLIKSQGPEDGFAFGTSMQPWKAVSESGRMLTVLNCLVSYASDAGKTAVATKLGDGRWVAAF